MFGVSSSAANAATNAADHLDSERSDEEASASSTVQTDSESEMWFSDLARDLLGKDAGFHLHLITGIPERSCYRYTARDKPRMPRATFLCWLLDSPHGYRILKWIMRDSTETWWINVQRGLRRSEAIDKSDAE